jgi:hypothetical protein
MGLGRRVFAAVVIGTALTAAEVSIWTRGRAAAVEEHLEANREWWSEMWARTELPGKETLVGTALAVGAVHGAGYGLVRPLLPANAKVAGGMYGAGVSLGLRVWSWSIRRRAGLKDPPDYKVSPPYRPVRSLVNWTAHGVALGWAVERASR